MSDLFLAKLKPGWFNPNENVANATTRWAAGKSGGQGCVPGPCAWWACRGFAFARGQHRGGDFGARWGSGGPEHWAFPHMPHFSQSGSGDAGYGLGLRFRKPCLKVGLLASLYF